MEDKLEGRRELIAGINHMGWLLELKDADGVDLYPEIRRPGQGKEFGRLCDEPGAEKHRDMGPALTIFTDLAITAPNPANIMQNTICFT